MGYTHTWNILDRSTLMIDNIADDIYKLYLRSEIPLAYEFDTPEQPPQFGPDYIRYNGINHDGHEAFIYPGDSHFNFCKTQLKPYDIIVASSLLVMKYHMSNRLIIASDGRFDEPQWLNAIQLYNSVFPDRHVPQLSKSASTPEAIEEILRLIDNSPNNPYKLRNT